MQNNISNRVTDFEYLINVSKGNTQFIKKIFETILKECPKEIMLMERAIVEINFELIRSTAHKMKATVVFAGLGKVINNEIIEIEKLAITHSGIRKIEMTFSKVKVVFQKAIQELKEFRQLAIIDSLHHPTSFFVIE